MAMVDERMPERERERRRTRSRVSYTGLEVVNPRERAGFHAKHGAPDVLARHAVWNLARIFADICEHEGALRLPTCPTVIVAQIED